MRDSHSRRGHSAPSSGFSIHLHCYRQTSPSAESHACRNRWTRHRSMPRRPLLAPSLEIGRDETDSRGTALRPAMSERDGPGLDGIFRRAFAEALGHRPGSSRPRSEGFLWIASALLLGTNLLLVLAVFVNLIGGLGPVNPSRILWAALGMDLVGVALLGWIFWDSAGPIEGRMRIVRRIVSLLLFLWVGLTAFWRFVLPAAAGTDLQALFSAFLIGPADFPTRFRQALPGMYQIFGVWIAAAAVFVAAHVLLAIVRRAAPADHR